jgi:3-dehydroquinate dehydratase-1
MRAALMLALSVTPHSRGDDVHGVRGGQYCFVAAPTNSDMDFDSFVLAASTATLEEESAAREAADAVEFRMDLAEAPLSALETYRGELPVIATNRVEWEGGEAVDDESRLAALVTAAEHKRVAAVDIEFEALRTPAGRQAAAAVREHGVRVIASAHDFVETPSESALLELLVEAAEVGDVGKVAVTAADHADTMAILNATHRATQDGHRVATMAMGETGRHTRAVAPLYGSRIGYAPVRPEQATAPGQYDLATLSGLIGQLDWR